MSYILEALKKAQAERQLGSTPTIHAMPLQAAAPSMASSARTPLWIAAGCLALLVVGGAVAWWRSASAPAPAVVALQPAQQPVAVGSAARVIAAAEPAQTPGQAPAPAQISAQMPAQAPAQIAAQTPTRAQAPAQVAAQTPVQPPAPRVNVSRVAQVPAPVAPAPSRASANGEPPVAPAASVAAAPRKVAAPAAEAAAPEDALPFMSQLPEPVRSDVPKVSFGGYMYSKNPADRLLLIDKVLRHEGEEVAPGLILEQLQPKAAVMNFRGTRYRVAY